MLRSLASTLLILVLAPLLGAAILAALVLEPRQRLEAPPADAAAAAGAFDLLREIRAELLQGADDSRWQVTETRLNAALASSARLRPGLAARAEVAEDGVALAASLPLLDGRFWLNARGMVAADDTGLAVSEVQIGRLPLPPGLVLPVVRIALDRLFGDDLGRTAMASVSGVHTDPPIVTIDFAVPVGERHRIADGVRAALGTRADPGERARVERYLADFETAAADGTLPRRGSVLPYLRFAAETAHATSIGPAGAGRGEPAAEMRAALLALAIYCGDARVGHVIGVPVPRSLDPERNGCSAATLAARGDLRRHFTVSSGLMAASSASAALGIGELKELMDSVDGGTGFSFDDMAANLAGARFADLLLSAPVEEWPRIAASMDDEAVLMPSIEDLPTGLTEVAFRERFGDVESPRYRAVVADIEARVAVLPLVRAFGG
jgi:uncharacterized protein YfiM (DUF2279 family)